MTTPTPAPLPRTETFNLRLSPAERLELDLVAAHMRLTLADAFRLLVRREAERIRAERQTTGQEGEAT